MYYEFFGLTQAPFRITPNTDFFFGGGNRGPILEALIYAVTHGEGIVKVSGEVGSGKTMLCNMLIERLPKNVETVYIANPNVSPDEILHTIAFDLQLGTQPQATRLEVMHALQDYLLKRHAEGKRVVMFVEESQGMPLATLEEMRLLSNLETRNDKLLQIVLFGQPELDEHLSLPNIRQLRDRITHGFTLAPLAAAEIREYLMFRLRAAGYRGPDLFPDKVIRLITQASGGLTRRVNLIADKALLAAFSENTHTLKPTHIGAALRDCEFGRAAPGASPVHRWSWVGAAIAGSALGAAGYAWYGKHNSPQELSNTPLSAPPAARSAAPVAAPVPAATQGVQPSTESALPALTVPAAAPPAAASAPDAPSPPASRVESANDILSQRLAATAQWLAPQNEAAWTVQILSSDSEANLREHLGYLKKFIEINNIYVYRTAGIAGQKTMLSVFYGSYDSLAAAQQKMAELPAQLKSNHPWPRTVHSIRSGIR